MAGRILNRREMRKQADHAEQTESSEAVVVDPAAPIAAPANAPRRRLRLRRA